MPCEEAWLHNPAAGGRQNSVCIMTCSTAKHSKAQPEAESGPVMIRSCRADPQDLALTSHRQWHSQRCDLRIGMWQQALQLLLLLK